MLLYRVLIAGLLCWELEARHIFQFVCLDGSQIEYEKTCDGKRDCPDGSDENHKLCFHTMCPKGMYRCRYGACIAKSFRCDGKKDCMDGSDESNCSGDTDGCGLNEYQCYNGECIDLGKVCDTLPDCKDGSDEVEHTCTEMICPKDGFKCKFGGCIHNSDVCDGFKDCVDGSDETDYMCAHKKCTSSECVSERIIVTCPPVNATRVDATCRSGNIKEGLLPCNEALPVGAIVEYKCKEYYIPINEKHENNKEMFCQEDGTWSRESLKCEPECGIASPPVTPLIVNGDISKSSLWPWHATLYILEEGVWNFACGGTLITEMVVLTAAHCTWDLKPEMMRVAFAKSHSEYSLMEEATQIVDVEKIVRQPLYQDVIGNFGSDIAVLILKQSVQLSAVVRPVCIDWKLSDITEHLTPLTIGTVVGMGMTENDTYSETLRTTQLPVVSEEECFKNQKRDFKKYLTYTSFCAGWGNGTGVCNGDSGGGLVFPKPGETHKWVLQGIVSVSPRRLGTSYCDAYHYTVFTKVGMYIEWLKNILAKVHYTSNRIGSYVV